MAARERGGLGDVGGTGGAEAQYPNSSGQSLK
jgi:hypothetical protein